MKIYIDEITFVYLCEPFKKFNWRPFIRENGLIKWNMLLKHKNSKFWNMNIVKQTFLKNSGFFFKTIHCKIAKI